MGVVGYILIGLMVGGVVKTFLPGNSGGSWPLTLLLGMGGAIIGGGLGSLLLGTSFPAFDVQTWIFAIGGAILSLVPYQNHLKGPRRRRPGNSPK
ncbi:MAG: GlsB/YeaQ/YmgE family stress response membrane protein [Kineosporiaceae bacterium]|nr:GlsB/YeaQ/YmgE family stress response membrane protein [Aeromicrobium sp.]